MEHSELGKPSPSHSSAPNSTREPTVPTPHDEVAESSQRPSGTSSTMPSDDRTAGVSPHDFHSQVRYQPGVQSTLENRSSETKPVRHHEVQRSSRPAKEKKGKNASHRYGLHSGPSAGSSRPIGLPTNAVQRAGPGAPERHPTVFNFSMDDVNEVLLSSSSGNKVRSALNQLGLGIVSLPTTHLRSTSSSTGANQAHIIGFHGQASLSSSSISGLAITPTVPSAVTHNQIERIPHSLANQYDITTSKPGKPSPSHSSIPRLRDSTRGSTGTTSSMPTNVVQSAGAWAPQRYTSDYPYPPTVPEFAHRQSGPMSFSHHGQPPLVHRGTHGLPSEVSSFSSSRSTYADSNTIRNPGILNQLSRFASRPTSQWSYTSPSMAANQDHRNTTIAVLDPASSSRSSLYGLTSRPTGHIPERLSHPSTSQNFVSSVMVANQGYRSEIMAARDTRNARAIAHDAARVRAPARTDAANEGRTMEPPRLSIGSSSTHSIPLHQADGSAYPPISQYNDIHFSTPLHRGQSTSLMSPSFGTSSMWSGSPALLPDNYLNIGWDVIFRNNEVRGTMEPSRFGSGRSHGSLREADVSARQHEADGSATQYEADGIAGQYDDFPFGDD